MNKKNSKSSNITGAISTTQKGAGYIDYPDSKKDSIYIEAGNLNTALNGDTVEVSISTKRIRGKEMEIGKVTNVISRKKEFFVGTVSEDGGRLCVVADDRKLYVPIMIDTADTNGAVINDKVYVEIKPWTDPTQPLEGKVLRILGQKGINNVEMESIVLDKGFEIDFPDNVCKEAREIGSNKSIDDSEISKRRDIRDTLTFTIDPFDAKDFDDAISFRKVGDKYEIGVHIADVSHYVREGTELDTEAQKRGCSVYLVDRTIPMLPEVLSNDVCSLNPHEDKLTFSAIFTIDSGAHIHSKWFGRTVINSNHRFTYEDAQESIDSGSGEHHEELSVLNSLAKLMRKKNADEGAIEFEQDEVKFKLDEDGRPIGVYVKSRLDTHKLVEEFMLLANREVARFIYDSIKKKGKRDTGSIYRIHDVPDKDRIMELTSFVKLLGYDLRSKDGQVTAKDINHLLDQIEGTPHESLIRTATIRSMQKAVYSTKNVGHFGLAFNFYTHFTSPIRRYPDLLVHRILARHINNEPFGDSEIVTLERIAGFSTAREIDASEAERASRKLKQVEYMSTHIGEIFTGTISGIAKWGIYVQEKETLCEGIIPVGKLGDEYFVFNERIYSMVGEKSNKKYTLGDSVTFKVVSADLDRKQLEFAVES